MAQSVLLVDRTVVRPVHPLLAAVVRSQSTATDRRELHLALAAAVADPMLRIRHLAIASVEPDAPLAAEVERCAQAAYERGDLPLAEELAGHALRLTPDSEPGRAVRVLAMARYHVMAGDNERASGLLRDHLDSLPPGRHRAMAHMLLGEGADIRGEERHLDLALEDAADEPDLSALILARRSVLLSINRVERIDEAQKLALAAASLVGSGGPGGHGLDPRIAHALAWTRVLRGESTDDLVTSASPGMRRYESSLERPAPSPWPSAGRSPGPGRSWRRWCGSRRNGAKASSPWC